MKFLVKPRTQERPGILIGKSGVTDALLSHVSDTLRAQGSVKLKVLRAAREGGISTKQVASEVARRLGATVVDTRGNTFVLKK